LSWGILNVTPDSFADGGLYLDPGAAEAAAIEMAARGADLIDVGGESTRPSSNTISADEEIIRVRPVLERLSRSLAIPISVDTSKPEVAEVAVGEGASIINDVTGLRGASGSSGGGTPLGYDASLARIAARSGAGLILMHSREARGICTRTRITIRCHWKSATSCARASIVRWRPGCGGNR
jgi:dihydropteroate synthase